MTKAWCIWCEMGQMPKHGYYWIHPECFFDMEAKSSNIKAVMEYMEGKSPKDIATEINGVPGTVKNTIIRMKRMGLIQRIGYAKYIITPKGRDYFKRISQPSTDQTSGESKT